MNILLSGVFEIFKAIIDNVVKYYGRLIKKRLLHADINCRYYKNNEKKSYLVFTNDGECDAWNIIIEGLDRFRSKPEGVIPPKLYMGKNFDMKLSLLTADIGRVMNLK